MIWIGCGELVGSLVSVAVGNANLGVDVLRMVRVFVGAGCCGAAG
jgi:hypothetical protein